MTGSASIVISKCQAAIPVTFLCRCRLRCISVPRISIWSYRFNHCFPSMARQAARTDTARLAYIVHWTLT